MKKTYLLFLLVFSMTTAFAGIITSTTTGGNWSAGASWVGGVAPSATDDVIIANGATVTINAAVTCNNLTVGQGTSGILQYNTGATGRALVVTGNIVINNGASFKAGATGAAVNTLSIAGNFTNNGTFTSYISTNVINITFNGTTSNQTLLNSGTITGNELRSVIVNNTFASGTVTIPSGLSMVSGTTLTLTAGILYAGAGGTGTFGLGTAAAGTFTCIKTTGSLLATTASFGAGVTTKTYTYNGGGSITTTAELTTASAVTIDILTINNALLDLTLNKSVKVNSVLNLTNGIVSTSGVNLLTLGTATAAGILSGGTAACYINGPFARTFGIRASAATYNASTLFPVGKNSIYMPLYLAPTTTAAGLQLKAEAFDTNGGTNISVSGTVSQHRWEASAINGIINLSNVFMRQNDSLATVTNKIIKATSPAGVYSSITPATVYATALLSSGTAIAAAEFNGTGYFSFGDACNPLPAMTGPLNICTNAVSQFYPTAGVNIPATGTWVSSAPGIAAVDVAGNITGVAPGTASITFTISAADGCNGLQVTKPVTITSCSAVPGGIGNNLISWYKGDAGLSTATWVDQTGSNTLTSAGAPSVNSSWLNFNPVAGFNGTTDYYNNTTADGWWGAANANTYYFVATGTGATGGKAVYSRGITNGGTTSNHGGRTAGNAVYQSGAVNTTPQAASSSWLSQPVFLSRGGFNGIAPGPYYVSANGGPEATAQNVSPVIPGMAPFKLGANTAAGALWVGDVAEVIAFNGKHTNTDYNKVESYLALKYGISLSQTTAQDYTASDGTTKMWNAAAAATGFNKNIFGIGRDNAAGTSGLDQRISQSANTGSLFTVATTNDFSLTNQDASRISLNNLNFETFADNNGANTWTATGAPVGYKILSRQWQVQETGTIGTVYLQFDTANTVFPLPGRGLTSMPFYILTDPNADGDFSDGTFIPLTNTTGSLWNTSIDFVNNTMFTLATYAPYAGADTVICVSGSKLYNLKGIDASGSWSAATGNSAGASLGTTTAGIATADFTGAAVGNYYFVYSIAGVSDTVRISISDCAGPGGVKNNLQLWLKADAGITTSGSVVSNWNDQTYLNVFTTIGSPALQLTSLNFNPRVAFDGSSAFAGNTSLANVTEAFAVANISNPGGGQLTGAVIGTKFYPPLSYFFHTEGSNFYTVSNNKGRFLSTGNNVPTSIMNVDLSETAPNKAIRLNGLDYNDPTSTDSIIPALLPRIGSRNQLTGFDYLQSGSGIAEVILYNGSKSSGSERQKIQSYLALKYGFTLNQSTPQNYLASSGINMWDATAAASGFNNNIFGIGRDDSSALNQKISKSQNAEGIVTLAVPQLVPFQNYYDFTSANQGRTSLLANLTFETVADNGGSATWNATPVKTRYKTMNREWQVQEAGTVGALALQFNLSNASFSVPALETGTSYYLIYTDASGNYNTATIVALINAAPGMWSTYTPVDFVNGARFTLATLSATAVVNQVCPGGVGEANGMQVWLKADAGVTKSGTNVNTWANQAQTAVVPMTTQATSGSSSQVQFAANSINYNPSVVLNGSGSSYLSGTMANTPPAGSALSFAVASGTGNNISGVFSINGNNGNIISDPTGQYGLDANGGTFYPTDWSLTPNTPYVIGADYTNLSIANGIVRANGKLSSPSTVTTLSYPDYTGDFYIGARTGFMYSGKVAEVVYYINNNQITETQKTKIESYLALKYGITLDKTGSTGGNYLLSNGATVWNAGDNPAYHRDVIALVRDDTSALFQKQSHTPDDSLRLFMGGLSANNQANTSTFNSNLSSLMIGNDGGTPQWSPSVSKPATIAARLVRTFKVTNTNFSNSFSMEIKCNAIGGLYSLGSLRFLVSGTPDFSGATIYAAPDVTFAFGSIIVNGISSSIIPPNTTRFVTVALSLIILPIELTAFNATAVDNKQVNLNWQTASVVHDYFTVQKSADGKLWTDVEKVKAGTLSSTAQAYSAIDGKPLKGISYYRLYQPGTNGEQRYSPVRSVHIYNQALIMVYPNPASGSITIEGATAELSRIRIYSMFGQDVTYLASVTSNTGTRITFDISRLSKGVYTIKSVTTTTKILKQ